MSNEPSTSESCYALPDIILDTKQASKTVEKANQLKRNVLPEKCQICRNPAVGYHYDVASCNGCKAFFRRTVITGRLVKCKNGKRCLDGNEPIDTTKRLCGGCRFAKCQEMGMNPLAIRAEITSKKGKLLKEEFAKKHEFTEISTLTNIGDPLSNVLAKLTLIEDLFDNLFNSNLPRNYGDLRPLSDIVVDVPITDVSKIPSLSFIKNQTFPDYCGFGHTGFLAAVEFMKSLEFSRKLDQDSLLKIIRHGALMVRGMMNSERSIRKFNSDIIRRADGSIAGKPMKNYNGIWVEQRKMVQKSLHAFLRIKIDTTEYLLLKAIVVCNPAVMGLSNEAQKIMTEERQKYAQCLFSYCLKEHGTRFGPDRFVSVLSTISIMENQQKEEKSFNVILRSFYSNVMVLVSPLYDEIMAS